MFYYTDIYLDIHKVGKEHEWRGKMMIIIYFFFFFESKLVKRKASRLNE